MTDFVKHLVEVRRRNLRTLAEKEGAAKLAELLGHSNPSFMSQMIGPNPTRPVSELTARKIEEQLGLAVGHLDLDFDNASA